MIQANENKIVIIGLTASGKTHLCDELTQTFCQDHTVFHSDDYIEHGFEQSLYMMISDVKNDANPKHIIEGVQGYRYLRKALQNQDSILYPDLVIIVECEPELRLQRYNARGEAKKDYSGFDKTLTKIWNDYIDALQYADRRPRIMNFNSTNS